MIRVVVLTALSVLALLFALGAQAAVDPARLSAVRSADEARKTLEYIQAELPASNGIASFNDLYLATTRNVLGAMQNGRFEDVAAMDRLTATFANLYFDALRAHFEGHGGVPLAWQVPFNRGETADQYRSVQFALTSMLAHIGRDLPIVLRTLYAGQASYPTSASVEYRDYLTINSILEQTFGQVEDDLFKDLVPNACETLLRGGANIMAVPSLKVLRTKAWLDGRALWKLRSHKFLSWDYVTGLDVGVAASNRVVFGLKARQ